MSFRLVYDSDTKKAEHVLSQEERRRFKNLSYEKGQLVEFIGKDKKNRGMGIVLEEIEGFGLDKFFQVKVFWQNLAVEEIVHKKFLRRCASIERGVVNVQKNSASTT